MSTLCGSGMDLILVALLALSHPHNMLALRFRAVAIFGPLLPLLLELSGLATLSLCLRLCLSVVGLSARCGAETEIEAVVVCTERVVLLAVIAVC